MGIGTLERPVAVAPGVFVVPRPELSALTNGELLETTVAVNTLKCQVACLEAQLVGEIEARGAYRDDGALRHPRRALPLGIGRRAAAGARREKPHITLTVDLPSLREESISGATAMTALWGASLGKDALLRLCCDAAVSVVVTDTVNGRPLDPDTPAEFMDEQGRLLGLGVPLAAGRTVRTVTTGQRKALVVRDGGCVFPGCGRSTGFCDAHHAIRHWSDGGDTNLDNLVLLCGLHHRRVHEDKRALEHDPHRPGLFS